MPGFRIVVEADDGREIDLGKHESDFLPRIGETMSLWSPLVADSQDAPFRGFVSDVTYDEFKPSSSYGATVSATVWLTPDTPDEGAPEPTQPSKEN